MSIIEKLTEGIRNFAADLVSLEQYITAEHLAKEPAHA